MFLAKPMPMPAPQRNRIAVARSLARDLAELPDNPSAAQLNSARRALEVAAGLLCRYQEEQVDAAMAASGAGPSVDALDPANSN